MICPKCLKDREYFREGKCICCYKAEEDARKENGNWVEETHLFSKGGVEIPSKTGHIDDNLWMRK